MKKHVLAISLLVLLVLGFLGRGLTSQRVFFGADEVASDLLHFSYPYREFWSNYIKVGKIPLWNQYLGSGLPFLAEAQSGMFFPLALILYFFLNPTLAFNLLIVSSFLLVAIGTYFYARKIGLTSPAAFFAAGVFTFSGFMVGHLRHVPIMTAVAFMPWMFLAVEEILAKNSLIWTLLLAVFIAFSIFAGHLTTTFMILLILALYFFIRLAAVFRERRKETFAEIGLFGLALILGILLAAIQLVPSLELYKYSTRIVNQDLSFYSSPYRFKYLTFFVAPYAYGDPSRGALDIGVDNFWENIGYIGILPLACALGAIFIGFKRKKLLVMGISAIVLVSLSLVLGNNFFLYKLFWLTVPGFSITRIPGRFLLFVDFFLAILAGFSLDYLKVKIQGAKYALIYSLIVLVSAIDLFIFGYHFNNVIPVSYFSEPKSVEFIKKDTSLFRVRSLETNRVSWKNAWRQSQGWTGSLKPYLLQRENLPPDLNLVFGLASPSTIYELSGHYVVAKPANLDSLSASIIYDDFSKALKVFGMMSVKYLISAEKLPAAASASLVYSDPNSGFPTYVYANQKVLPRAYLVGKVNYQADDQGALVKIFDASFDPASEVILQTEDKFKGIGTSKNSVQITDYHDGEVSLTTVSDKPGILVLSETFYPGWQAFIDGGASKIYRANYAYQAIFVPAGSHQIIFVFRPQSFGIGRTISAGALAVLIMALLAGWLYQRLHRPFSKFA